ncbi:hypothetical protein AHAS_Ahas04G0110300 [Arachis hypogaea]|nr:uncharacterized protein LOC112794872 [Arachis hypogaea]
MNLDELMRSGIIDESGQVVQNPCSTFSSNNPSFLFNTSSSMDNNNNNHHHLEQPNLPDTTTFEEILAHAEMINHNTSNNNYDVGNQGNNVLVDPKSFIGVDPIVMASHQANWLQIQYPSMQQHHQENVCHDFGDSKPVVNTPVMETGHSNSSLEISMPVAAPAAMSSCTCSDSKGVVFGDCGRRSRKRGFSAEVQEQGIDRKQKRMAKNRESAAKSRAKKQLWVWWLIHFFIFLVSCGLNGHLNRYHAGITLLRGSNSNYNHNIATKIAITNCNLKFCIVSNYG